MNRWSIDRVSRRGLLAAAGLAGCGGARPGAATSRGPIVYCAHDEEFARPRLEDFTRETGLEVGAVYDTESTKSVGLAARLLRERRRPAADVFWNNEPLHTLRLAAAGLLEAYPSPRGREYPAACRSSRDEWFGFAARARVLLVHRPSAPQPPRTLEELAAAAWKGQVGIAKPLFGSTATHLACLFAAWGPAAAAAWLRRLKANGVQVFSGNKGVAQAVGAGTIACGLTDTDDALAEVAAGRDVRIAFLDQADGELGTLVFPNTLALIAGGPNPAAGRRLIEALLAPACELALADGPSGQFPLHPSWAGRPHPLRPPRAMAADFAAAADRWDEVAAFVAKEFLG